MGAATEAWLQTLDPAARAALDAGAKRTCLPAGVVVYRPGDACRAAILLCDGRVKVTLLAADGHEILLYRIGPGETCVVTTACLLGGSAYNVEATTETPVTALLIPRPLCETLLADSPSFRRFVFDSFGQRLAAMMALIQDVAFTPFDRRLAGWLLGRPDAHLAITHQAIAAELGTAREVVSRRLKHLERTGLVTLARGAVVITDRAALARIVADDGS